MTLSCYYKTPEDFDDLKMTSDGTFLTGLFFVSSIEEEQETAEGPEVFKETKKWLDLYFKGEIPDFLPSYKAEGLTPFQNRVSRIMRKIPYGKTMTYGEIANEIARERGIKKMSAQAVGGAAGANPIGIVIPCHRVVGAGGKLTGYGGGLKNKISLLKLEGALPEKP